MWSAPAGRSRAEMKHGPLPSREPWTVRFALRLYALLARTLPPAFRKAYGREMLLDLEALLSHRRHRWGTGAVVVGSIDNFLRPLFMQGSSMSTVVVFFSLIGGLQVFGLMGLIYGPLVFAVALVLFKIYEKEFSGFLDSQDSL